MSCSYVLFCRIHINLIIYTTTCSHFSFTVRDMLIIPNIVGITWIFGMVAVLDRDSVYEGIFAILNLVQVRCNLIMNILSVYHYF